MNHDVVARKSVMHTFATFTLGLWLLCACGLFTAPVLAAELCHRPSPQALIAWYNHTYPEKSLRYSPGNSAIYHPISILRTDKPAVYWIGLAWLAPESGALFAVSCDGTPVNGVPTGAIGKLSHGPVMQELGQSVMLVYVNKETGNCVHDAIQIAALKDNKIISLWEHGYNQGLNVATKGKLKNFIAENYTLNVEDNGLTLRLRGARAVYAYLKDGSQASVPSATQSLETETWHWDASKLRFIPERPYRGLPVCSAQLLTHR